MTRQLFNFRNVPEDEAGEVRALLDDNGVAYYETPPSRWGISMGAIWVADEAEYRRARALLDDYQSRRAERVRAEHAARQRNGEVDTFTDLLRRNPVQVLAYLAGAAAIVAVMMWPVWLMM